MSIITLKAASASRRKRDVFLTKPESDEHLFPPTQALKPLGRGIEPPAVVLGGALPIESAVVNRCRECGRRPGTHGREIGIKKRRKTAIETAGALGLAVANKSCNSDMHCSCDPIAQGVKTLTLTPFEAEAG